MTQPAACQGRLAFTRAMDWFDSVPAHIAGAALLAGARAFSFVVVLAWRDPVAGGAALVLLALIGWLRRGLGSQTQNQGQPAGAARSSSVSRSPRI
jgi:hypothetical protein